jgi:hypothetical protein
MRTNELSKLGQVKILCGSTSDDEPAEDILKNLSGAVLSHEGQYLWLGTDELTAIERFTRLPGDEPIYGDHQRFYFRDWVDDFDDEDGEVDIEGLAYDGGYLWIVGSHSSRRKKAKIEATKFQIEKKELKAIDQQRNRYLLARIPILESGELDRQAPQRAWLKRSRHRNTLIKALEDDEYLEPFKGCPSDRKTQNGSFYIPSKENGLDIEGLAVRGNKIFIGLRGPVLRGIAIALEIEVEDGSSHQLNLKPIGDRDRAYKRHFLDLGGLGIRELCWSEDSDSLLILAGPTMDLDGSHSLFRLDQPFELTDKSLSSPANQQLTHLGDIPHQPRHDRAEGLTLGNQAGAILVVYDSPAPERLIRDEQETVIGVVADVWRI